MFGLTASLKSANAFVSALNHAAKKSSIEKFVKQSTHSQLYPDCCADYPFTLSPGSLSSLPPGNKTISTQSEDEIRPLFLSFELERVRTRFIRVSRA